MGLISRVSSRTYRQQIRNKADMTSNCSYFPHPHEEGGDVTYPIKHLLDTTPSSTVKAMVSKSTETNDQPLLIGEGNTIKNARKSMNIRELVSFKYELLEIVKRYYRRVAGLEKTKNLEMVAIQSKIKKIHIQINLIDKIISLYEKEH